MSVLELFRSDCFTLYSFSDEFPLNDPLEVETKGPLQVVRVVVVEVVVRIAVHPVTQRLQLKLNIV